MAGPNYWWQHQLTQWRHSPCLMQPVSLMMLIIMLVFWLVTMVLTIPSWLLGFLVAPILSRGTWLIEFLYPLPIARWGHLMILKWSQPKIPLDDKAANYHSRTLEQRVEVVKGRVFVHPIPQLLDNLGYLVVCLPPTPPTPNQSTSNAGESPLGKVSVVLQFQPDPKKLPKGPIVAFLVDCGDADTVAEQVELIRETHYPKYPSIQIQMVMSTHKHHDHTAGNVPLQKIPKLGQHINHIVGGAVERVPGCNLQVADGDRLTLPVCGKNDMNKVVHVEVVAVPAHTRGSVVYLLRPNHETKHYETTTTPCFAFTGDTMFSGGGGVPFEAGSNAEIDQGAYRDNAHGAIRAGMGSHAVERCFAEILVRGSSHSNSHPFQESSNHQDSFLIFPGHEYTTELLSRQFAAPPSGGISDANKWKNFPPHVFFETVSELYVAMHRRSLPQVTGKVLAAAPTTLRRELAINPHLRSLARRAELVVQAIRLWDAYFYKPKGARDEEAAITRDRHDPVPARNGGLTRRRQPDKTPSAEKSWNMDVTDAGKSVFTTVYTSDLESMITDLASGRIDAEEAVLQLENLKTGLKEPVIRRRPIPGTLPSERVVYKGLIGFALLGSRPSAMTLSDSRAMKLPPPIVSDTSCILVSKKRLITMLSYLGFLPDSVDGQLLLSMIHTLWREAHDYINDGNANLTPVGSNDSDYNAVCKREEDNSGTALDDEEGDYVNDLVELGTLKWILYGFPAKQPSWFSCFCMPCGMSSSDKALQKRQDKRSQQDHPVSASCMKRRHGELVRHDVMTCKLCMNVTGGFADDDDEETDTTDDGNDDDSVDGRRDVPTPINPHYLGSSNNSNNPASQVNAAASFADDESYVSSTDSAVEVSHMTTLMASQIRQMEKTEEKLHV